MAYESNLTNVAQNKVLDRVNSLIAGFRDKSARRRVFRETFRELNALSTRELNDLGIARSEIRRVAYHAAYQNG
jgi:uncharacterized protein YjiS (DUF1127 family)